MSQAKRDFVFLCEEEMRQDSRDVREDRRAISLKQIWSLFCMGWWPVGNMNEEKDGLVPNHRMGLSGGQTHDLTT